MNDRFKFRARSNHSHEFWLYGGFHDGHIVTCDGMSYDIDIDTVGQCTGLKDKNGQLIFEGDIVEWNDSPSETYRRIRRAIVNTYPSLYFELTRNTPTGTPAHKFHYGNFIYTDTETHIEVIGNIHKNGDLLN